MRRNIFLFIRKLYLFNFRSVEYFVLDIGEEAFLSVYFFLKQCYLLRLLRYFLIKLAN